MRHQIASVSANWEDACNVAQLSDADRRLLWRRQFLTDLAFEGIEDHLAEVTQGLLRD